VSERLRFRRGLVRCGVRLISAVLSLASLSLAACDTLDALNRHAVSSQSCDCYADLHRDNTPIIGTHWKI
jgi:hypothetical protein